MQIFKGIKRWNRTNNRNELIKNYTEQDDSIEIKGENNSIFQLTTTNNELDRYDGKKLNNNNL